MYMLYFTTVLKPRRRNQLHKKQINMTVNCVKLSCFYCQLHCLNAWHYVLQ